MKSKADHLLSILFVVLIVGSGLITVLFNPLKIAGGLYRGWASSSPESSVFDKLINGLNQFETRFNTYYIAHNAAVNGYGGIQRLIGRTHVDDVERNYSVLKLKNGYLTFAPTVIDYNYAESSKYISELSFSCRSLGADFLFVPLISKSYDTSLFPDHYPIKPINHYNHVTYTLNKNGVDVLNLMECIDDQNLDIYSLFYKTDHHWTASTGLWVAKQVIQKVNELYTFDFNQSLLEEDLFICEHYDDIYLGSQGKRVGKYYGGIDDFEVIYPKYETNFDIEYYNLDEKRSGDFQDAFIFRNNLDLNNPLTMDTNMYDTYMDGNHALIKCHNNKAENHKKCLIILNSYGCVVAPYLALIFSELDCIDIRGFKEKTIEQYVEETKPDLVLYMLTTP